MRTYIGQLGSRVIILHRIVSVVDNDGTPRATRALGFLGKREGRESSGFRRVILTFTFVGSISGPYIALRRQTVVKDGCKTSRLTAGSGKRAWPCSTSNARGNLLRRSLGL
jgi:hypothetical protein